MSSMILRTAICIFCSGILASCASPSGIGEPSVVEVDAMIRNSAKELLQAEIRARGENGGADNIWVACLPVTSAGSMALRENARYYNNTIEQEVSNSGLFRPVARNLIDVGMRAANMTRAENLLLAAKRVEFLKHLTDQGTIPEFFLICELSTLDQRSGGRIVERNINLNLKLMHSKSGEIAQTRSASIQQR